jgi:hypothetical protein
LLRGETFDLSACKAIAKDMRQASNGDVTKAEARSFAKATNNALKNDTEASQLRKLARAGIAFEKTFAKSPFNPVSLAMVRGCAASGIGASLIAPSTTTPNTPSHVSCSSATLFSLVVQADPSLSATYAASDNGPISAYCSDGWAVLNNFTIQVGSGNGIAVFQQEGSGWTFIQVGDDSGDGPDCAQYPAAALKALGSQLCTSNSSSTVPVQLSPEEQFASDAISQIPTVTSAVNSGALTSAEIGSYGDSICNLMPQYLNTYGPGPSAFNQIANEFSEGLTQFRITGPDDGAFVSLAIYDICPIYSGDIPSGATG